MKSIKVSLDNKDTIEYKPIIEDIIKFSTIQIITHLFICLTKPDTTIFDPDFFQGLFIISFSLIIYWIVIKKII